MIFTSWNHFLVGFFLVVVVEVPAFGKVLGQDYDISPWAGKCRGYFIN